MADERPRALAPYDHLTRAVSSHAAMADPLSVVAVPEARPVITATTAPAAPSPTPKATRAKRGSKR